jgi:hypothetical protein
LRGRDCNGHADAKRGERPENEEEAAAASVIGMGTDQKSAMKNGRAG